MTHLVDDSLNQLSEEHKELLAVFNHGWTRHQKMPDQVEHHAIATDIKELYARNGLAAPSVIVCDSIFQLTVYPVIISLILEEADRDYVIPVLRRNLQTGPWNRLWHNLDQQFGDSQVTALKIQSDKMRQQHTRTELNRVIHKIYENEGGTIDTHNYAPRLTPIGLQINSNFQASVKSLTNSLEKDVGGWVSNQAMERAKERLNLINTMTRRVETQLDLQLIPQILARTINTFKGVLEAGGERFQINLDKARSEIQKGRSEILSLINQSESNEDMMVAPPIRPTLVWNWPRMGAYRDPAIRLISSSLQLELFKKSRLMDAFPVHFFLKDIAQNAYSEPNLESLNIWGRVLETAYALLFYEGLAFVCEYPVHSKLDPEHRFHDENGPALKFSDDFQAHFWHGRRVAKELIEEPESITVDMIEAEKNVETRTILIERYGLERFLKESGARKIHEDDCGVLYRKSFNSNGSTDGNEPLVVVMVNNSTPEPDGSLKQYFLRVPPNVGTAREAVAWTFRLNEDNYGPIVES
ncbi:MAG: hypothetical protein K2X93_12245 [Candidatus Obscuribacterales bacterium]|nr:hypothetical protein [Candidatus Obscuribacterales bacterium]